MANDSFLIRVQRDVARERGKGDLPRHFVGIDLGTTNSTAAVFDAEALYRGEHDNLIRLVPVRQETAAGLVEDAVLPSVIARVDGEWLIGQGARDCRRNGMLRGRDIFFSTKSEMGLGREPFYPLAASRDCDAPYKVAGILLDYLLTVHLPAKGRRLDLKSPRAILVLDFGGGTCDVSIVRVQGDFGGLTLANLSISRYERLGGDNIDAAIAEQVLLPQLLEQNGLSPLDFTWTEKRDRLLPQLLPAAEALKLSLRDPRRAKQELASYAVELPQSATRRGGSTAVFERPSLTRDQFAELLAPFLDTDFLFERGSELNPVTSIFAPIGDALERAQLQAKDVDAVLFAGGSSLLPEVRRAVGRHFKKAALLEFPDPERTLFAVARGAALHSFFLHGLGRPLLRPIAQETVGVLADGKRFVPLIPAGTELPFPADGSYAQFADLAVPRDLMREVQIVVAADSDAKVLEVAHLHVHEVKSGGEPIAVSYRLDANKVLEVRASLASDPSAACEVVLENPLCSTGLKGAGERRMLELEEDVRAAEARGASAPDATEKLATLCLDESRYERALDWARKTLATLRKPQPWVLNTMGIAYQKLAAFDRSEAAYREALRCEPGMATAWFNLGLVLGEQGRVDDALAAARRAMELRPANGAYLALYAMLLRKAGQLAESVTRYREAAQLLDESGLENDFERSWRVHVAHALDDSYRVTQLADEERAARPAAAPLPYDPDKLPGLRAGALVREAR